LRAGTVAGLLNTYLHGYYVAHSKLICLSGFPMQAIVFARCWQLVGASDISFLHFRYEFVGCHEFYFSSFGMGLSEVAFLNFLKGGFS
jgi:hypothetical protein